MYIQTPGWSFHLIRITSFTPLLRRYSSMRPVRNHNQTVSPATHLPQRTSPPSSAPNQCGLNNGPWLSHTVIFSISTATSVSCKYTRWVINADVGYDIDIPSVPWPELSVRTIALASGQHKTYSPNKLRIALDEVHRRVTFRLTIVFGIYCLVYQQGESGAANDSGLTQQYFCL